MSLPRSLQATLEQQLGGSISRVQPAFGGDINQAARITCGSQDFFVKWNASAPPDMFPQEAYGLQLLAGAGALRVPAVHFAADPDGSRPGYLVMDWIETGGRGARSDRIMAQFGEGLAALHQHTAAQHGLDHDNFIGRLPQPNIQTGGWTAFYREQRIGYQMALARRSGRLPARREDLLTRLMARLDDLLDDDAMPPALLHGDLWGGNYLLDTQGQAVLIDPAVYYGHREMDLAMTELFGGFSEPFYAAYQGVFPTPGYEDRRALYQLYYIIVHLNLFGESYGGRVDALAARYVGWS